MPFHEGTEQVDVIRAGKFRAQLATHSGFAVGVRQQSCLRQGGGGTTSSLDKRELARRIRSCQGKELAGGFDEDVLMRLEILKDPVDHLATPIRVSLSFQGPENCSSNVTTEHLRLIGLIDHAGQRPQHGKAVERPPDAPRDQALI